MTSAILPPADAPASRAAAAPRLADDLLVDTTAFTRQMSENAMGNMRLAYDTALTLLQDWERLNRESLAFWRGVTDDALRQGWQIWDANARLLSPVPVAEQTLTTARETPDR